MLALWRLFIPTWRFYDQVGLAPELWLFYGDRWRPALSRPKVTWSTLFWNPAGNLYFARVNLLERLLLEIPGTIGPIANLVTYQLVKRLAIDAAEAEFLDDVRQFKINVRGEDVLVGDL